MVGNPHNNSEQETNWSSILLNSRTLDVVDVDQVGCDGEVAIFAREREFWRDAPTVEDYLSMFVELGTLRKVENPNKLWEYMQG